MNHPAHIADEASLSINDFLDFVAAREATGRRWELLDGRPVAMTGSSQRHQKIVRNLTGMLDRITDACGCDTLPGDLFVRNASPRFLGVPDVLVRCGPPQDEERIVTDPTLIVEVLSPSTMSRDRGYKFEQYAVVDTLRQILFVYQTRTLVESWTRRAEPGPDEELWDLTTLAGLDATVPLVGLPGALSLAEIYRSVVLAADA